MSLTATKSPGKAALTSEFSRWPTSSGPASISVYGIVATATHGELERLYRHAAEVLGGVYLPEAVLTETRDGQLRPALCYIAPLMEPQPATNEYVDRIVGPAKKYGFPAWYIERLERFRPNSATSS